MSECNRMAVRIYKPDHNLSRIAVADDRPWFSLDDVCRELRLDPVDILCRLDDDEVFFVDEEEDSGRVTHCFISESGLRKAYLESRTAEACRFRHRLFRKHLLELMKR